MKDNCGREIDYLRISLTDLCNLRCIYCMPEEGVEKLCHGDVLSLEETAEIAGAAVELGIRKIRLTGGEPLVKRGIIGLCERLSALPGLEELTLTTNGTLLPAFAKKLKAAGVSRVNISLDTLDPEKYRRITRGGELSDALAGIRAAEEAGLTPIKLNTVLMGGVNDDEISALAELTRDNPYELRFIELMPMTDGFAPSAFISAQAVRDALPGLVPLNRKRGVAELWRLPGAAGMIGLIRPISHAFCETCNRIRLTSDGRIKTCLHTSSEIPLRGLHGDALTEALRSAILSKPPRRGTLSAEQSSGAGRSMNQIGG